MAHSEREAAKVTIKAACEAAIDETINITPSADKGYDVTAFVGACLRMGVTAHRAHTAQKTSGVVRLCPMPCRHDRLFDFAEQTPGSRIALWVGPDGGKHAPTDGARPQTHGPHVCADPDGLQPDTHALAHLGASPSENAMTNKKCRNGFENRR